MTKLLTVAAALAAAFAACISVSCTGAYAQEPQALLLVASERLQGPYRGSVILAAPSEGGHVGVILNRPSRVGMAGAFADCAPCSLVRDPIYFGGPLRFNVVAALTLAAAAPDATSIAMGPGVWLVVQAQAIDRLIEAAPNASRYFAGHVYWAPGELAAELEQGLFHAKPLDKSKLMLPDTSGLHEELSPASRKGLTAS
jgi:putative transcriptional regulator